MPQLSEFEGGVLVGGLVVAIVGSLLAWLIARVAYHRGRLRGFAEFAEVFHAPEAAAPPNGEPEVMPAVKKTRRTRTMFGDCDERGRYSGG